MATATKKSEAEQLVAWNAFIARAKSVTAKYRDTPKEPATPPKVKSDFLKGLESVWDKADFGCQSAHVAQILKLMVKQTTKEVANFEPKTRKIDSGINIHLEKFAVIVPLEDKGGHNYPLNVPAMCRYESKIQSALLRIGSTRSGNLLSGKCRYASDAEIDFFFGTFVPSMRSKIISNRLI